MKPIKISIVVPIYNEEESLPILHREIADSLDSMGDDADGARALELLAGKRDQNPPKKHGSIPL